MFRWLAALLLIAAPICASADGIAINSQGSGTWIPVAFSPAGFFAAGLLDVEQSVFLPNGVELRSATMLISSGPLQSMDVDLIEATTSYSFGPATFTLLLEVASAPGQPSVLGRLRASVLALDFGVYDEEGIFEPPRAVYDGILGPGILDRGLAKALGVGRRTPGGWLSLLIEGLDAPYEDDREGVIESAFDVQTVPEPSAVLLFTVAALGMSARRRWSRR
jgi:hypothetical protein